MTIALMYGDFSANQKNQKLVPGFNSVPEAQQFYYECNLKCGWCHIFDMKKGQVLKVLKVSQVANAVIAEKKDVK